MVAYPHSSTVRPDTKSLPPLHAGATLIGGLEMVFLRRAGSMETLFLSPFDVWSTLLNVIGLLRTVSLVVRCLKWATAKAGVTAYLK